MTAKQKKLIESASPYVRGIPLHGMYIIPTGKLCPDDIGISKWDSLILIGIGTNATGGEALYLVEKETPTDVVAFFGRSTVHAIDVPHKYGTIRIQFTQAVTLPDLDNYSVTPCNAGDTIGG